MKNKIKELAEQAWNATAVSPDFGHPVSFAEKLAELIVKECMALMAEQKEYYAVPGKYETMEYYARMEAKEDAFSDAEEIIKEHFGVES